MVSIIKNITTPAWFKISLVIIATITLITTKPALAEHVYYVDDVSYTDILAYDSSATTACIHNKLAATPTTRVIFKKDNGKVFYWSPATPNLYFSNLGWSSCKGYHRKG